LSLRGIISGFVSLALIAAGAALIAYFFLGAGTVSPTPQQGFNVPEAGPDQQTQNDPNAPEDTTLTLTVPKMERLDGVSIPSAAGDDAEALRNNAGIHLRGTGFPWQQEANVYIAGHRLGYPTTDSFLAFYDQQNLEAGDEIYITDTEGRQYTYEVFEEFVVSPSDLWVTEPEPGRNILTLQTCTLPDYSQRIIHRAELVSVS
jgi:sortase A